ALAPPAPSTREKAEALAARLGSLDKGIAVKFANIAFSNEIKTGGFTDSFKKATAGDKVIDKPLKTDKDFEDAAADMNKTISDATNGMINDFVDKDALPEYIWSLISAIGFEGTFTHPFVHAKELIEDPGYKTRLEKEKDFGPSLLANAKRYHRKGDEEPSVEKLAAAEWNKDAAKYLEVPYLKGAQHEIIPRLKEASDAANGRMKLAQGGLKVIDNARFTAVMFPYGDEQGASFVAMMPKGNLTPKQLLLDVGSAQLAAAFANAEARDFDAKDKFQLGAFKTEFKPEDFLEVLRKLAPLKFSGMIASGETAPNAARLKAVIELGPRQTKAAQVVEMAMMESAMHSEPPPPIAINFDQSYAYAIITKDGTLPLWQGIQQVEAKKD
ncbi:MAG TPA: hypothetical protein VLC93_00970, partial [Myxococcota bacterium]|nr:hypothetical protein [Myxococcota bacterium]